MPVKCAGTRTEPPLSDPSPAADMPAAIAADSPPLEPPGDRSRSHGFRSAAVQQIVGLVGHQEFGTVGCAQNERTGGAQIAPPLPHLRAGCSPLWMRLPISHRNPAVAIEDFTVTGRPCSGPRGAVCDCICRACVRGHDPHRNRQRHSVADSAASICAMCASASSLMEIWRARSISSCSDADFRVQFAHRHPCRSSVRDRW